MRDGRPHDGPPGDVPEADDGPRPAPGPVVAITVVVGLLVALLLVLFELFVAR